MSLVNFCNSINSQHLVFVTGKENWEFSLSFFQLSSVNFPSSLINDSRWLHKENTFLCFCSLVSDLNSHKHWIRRFVSECSFTSIILKFSLHPRFLRCGWLETILTNKIFISFLKWKWHNKLSIMRK